MSFADAFDDPSIRQAIASDGTTNGLEGANPFETESTRPVTQVMGANHPPISGGSSAPPAISPTQINARPQPPPAYSQTGQQRIDTSEFERQRRELAEKEADLARREQALREQGPPGARKNNWPPLPEKFCVGPCFYQDINVEIPPEFQRIVRYLYYLWMYHSVLLFVNMIGALALVIKFGVGSEGSTFGLSLLYLILFTPVAYVCWFRPVYKAFRNDSSFNFMIFFFVFFFQLMVSVVHAIGIPNLGTCGFIIGLETVSAGGGAGTIVVGIIVLMISLALAVGALMDFLMLLKVHRIYRSTGASLAKAQEEVRSGVLSNDTARSFMADAATAAVRSQMNSGGDRRF